MCEKSLRAIELQFARLKFILILPCKPFWGPFLELMNLREIRPVIGNVWNCRDINHVICMCQVGQTDGTGILLHQLRLYRQNCAI